jgi:hypothetical protein
VYKDTREFYITFRDVVYSVTPVLPTEVDDMSVWVIELGKDELKSTNPLTIFQSSFQMTKVTELFPWQNPINQSEPLPGYKIKFNYSRY